MTKTQVLSIAKRRLGMRTDLDADIILEMDVVQAEMSRIAPYPWFLRSVIMDVVVSKTYTFGSDFLALAFPERNVFFTDAPANLITTVADDEYLTKLLPQTGVPARPTQCAMRGTSLYFFPEPDMSYPVEIHVYKYDTAPSLVGDNNANLWMTHAGELLALAAARAIATDIRDQELLGYLENNVEMKRSELNRQTIAKNEEPMGRLIQESYPNLVEDVFA